MPLGVLSQHRTSCSDNAHTRLHTHPFNGPFSGTTQVSRYQKGKTNLDFSEERDSEWHWHQLGHMQVSTSLQTDNHASIPPLSFSCSDNALSVFAAWLVSVILRPALCPQFSALPLWTAGFVTSETSVLLTCRCVISNSFQLLLGHIAALGICARCSLLLPMIRVSRCCLCVSFGHIRQPYRNG